MLDETRTIEMNMHVDRTWRGDHAFAISYRGPGRYDQARINPIHNRRVTGLADTHDAAVADAEIALDDSDHRIDHEDIAQQKIQRAFGAGYASHSDAVAQCLAAAMQTFIAVDGVVLLDHRR